MPAVATVFADAEELGESLARDILAGIARARHDGRRFLLGCPGGRSLVSTYRALARQAGAGQADLAHVVIVMMDEYLQPAGAGFERCSGQAHYSCRGFADREILDRLNRAVTPGSRIPSGHVWLPDPGAPAAFDRRLADAGGVDLFLLASGASDGHVAFNPPGTAIDSVSRIVRLAETTRRDNLETFPAFRDVDEVPTHGISVGLGTIAGLSAAAAMVLTGAHKQAAARRLLGARSFTPDWPATVVHACRDGRILLDRPAAGGWRQSDPRRAP